MKGSRGKAISPSSNAPNPSPNTSLPSTINTPHTPRTPLCASFFVGSVTMMPLRKAVGVLIAAVLVAIHLTRTVAVSSLSSTVSDPFHALRSPLWGHVYLDGARVDAALEYFGSTFSKFCELFAFVLVAATPSTSACLARSVALD